MHVRMCVCACMWVLCVCVCVRRWVWPTSRISRLYHELFDDPVKDVSIVVTITTVYTEILYRLWAAEDIRTNKHCVISALYVTSIRSTG